jgi:hypothetical protein
LHFYFLQGNILAVLKENGLTTFVDLIIQAGLEETFSQPSKDFFKIVLLE